MALNLSTLTSPATSGDVLQEVLTTADFLEPVPVLRNLARGSNKGGDAEQDVALNQPKALPLIDGDGYLYCPPIAANYAYVENPIIPATADFDLSVEFVVAKFASGTGYSHIASQYQGNTSGRVHLGFFDHQKRLYFFCGGDGTNPSVNLETSFAAIVEGQRHTARVTRVGNTFTLYLDGVLQQTATSGVATLQTVGTQIGWGSLRGLNGAIFSVTEGSNTNVDFTATNVRHGDTKFKCATGQVVTINQDSSSSNDVATIIKKPVLRFDGVNSGLQGLFGQTITDGYMFAAFSVLGGGGESFGRLFTLNSTGASDTDAESYIPAYKYLNSINGFSGVTGLNTASHDGLYSSENGDILNEHKFTASSQLGKVNGADVKTNTANLSSVSIEEFNICFDQDQTRSVSVDLEYLALFPADSVPDEATATKIRNYINKRNNVFDLKDGFGYYFYNPQDLSSGAVTSWNGRIVGSDNGDTDKLATQTDANDQPVGDGYVVTFADNSDHLDIPSTTQAGWQVVGTSLGTFAYRVNANAVTELNLLGNLGNASYRQTGDLYGVILLPESATGKDIEDARKLLIDRGAADASTIISAPAAWFRRYDIVEFKNAEFPDALTLGFAFEEATNLSKISTVNAPICPNFSSAWKGTTALTSFPAGAKLGTDAENVNFTSAWQSSGLTSFSTPLPTATTLTQSFQACSSLTQFTSNLSSALTLVRTWRNSGLTSFSVELPSARFISQAWEGCSDLVDFSAEVFDNWNPSSITSEVFNLTWSGCTSLTAQSVENILTSIDASGKYATTNGASGGSALADAGIDIDYNGDPLTAATTAAIDSLSGKGWQVYINGELVIPNILDLEPAAAYSLRSFDADADPNVVNVRRSSDNATSDFTASEVSDGTLVAFVGAGNDGHVTTWYDQRKIVETGDAYGTTISGTADGSPTTYNQLAPAVAGEFYRVRFTVSNLDPRGRVRYRNYAGSADVAATAGLGSLIYFHANGDYEAYVPSDDGLSLWFYPDSGAGGSFDYSEVSVQQVAEVPNNADQAVASSQPKIVDGGTLVTEGGLPSINFHTEVSNLSLDHSDLYGQATLDSYYVTSTTDTTYIYPSLAGWGSDYGWVAEQGSSTGGNGAGYGSGVLYVNGTLVTPSSRNDVYNALLGHNLAVHRGAGTSNAAWETYGMNFGSYLNQTGYSYTGKLQEMIFFNTDQSANRTGIEANINDHFDIYS